MQQSPLVKEFLQYKEMSLMPQTLYLYESRLDIFQDFIKKDLQKVTLADISSFAQYLRNNDYASSTTASYIASIKSFYKYAFSMGKSTLPYEMIKKPKVKETVPLVIPKEVYEQLDLYWSQGNRYKDIQKRLIFRLLWDTGVRVGKLVKLEIRQIQVDQNFATIERQKNVQQNIIMWSEDTSSLMRRYLEMKASLGDNSPFLFASHHGNRKHLSKQTTNKKT